MCRHDVTHKPEVHNMSQLCQSRTEPPSSVTCTEKLLKFWCAIPEIRLQTDGQTDRQAHRNALLSSRGRSNKVCIFTRPPSRVFSANLLRVTVKARLQHMNWIQLDWPITSRPSYTERYWTCAQSSASASRSFGLVGYRHCSALDRLVENTCIPMLLSTWQFSCSVRAMWTRKSGVEIATWNERRCRRICSEPQ